MIAAIDSKKKSWHAVRDPPFRSHGIRQRRTTRSSVSDDVRMSQHVHRVSLEGEVRITTCYPPDTYGGQSHQPSSRREKTRCRLTQKILKLPEWSGQRRGELTTDTADLMITTLDTAALEEVLAQVVSRVASDTHLETSAVLKDTEQNRATKSLTEVISEKPSPPPAASCLISAASARLRYHEVWCLALALIHSGNSKGRS